MRRPSPAMPSSMLMALLLLLLLGGHVPSSTAAAAAAVAEPADPALEEATSEAFHEEALFRPLPDGKVAFVAHFRQEAPLRANHFEKFPKAMAQIARAARLADMELSFTQVRATLTTQHAYSKLIFGGEQRKNCCSSTSR